MVAMLRIVREYVDFQARARPEAIYLVAPESDRTMSFAGLQQASRRLAHYLVGLGIQPGEKVAMLMHNGYQAGRLFIGTIYGGYCVTPLNLLAQPSQFEYVLNHCDARVMFASPDQVERLNAALKKILRQIKVVVCDVDAVAIALDEASDAPVLASVSEEDDALMMYTSGTTGVPKGVVLANRSVIAGGQF